MLNTFDICDFGAKADGKTDCTAAVQAALDAAAKVGGKVIVPPGEFLCGYVKMGRNVTLEGTYAWEFRNFGGSILKLNDRKAKCLVDMTGAFGAAIVGMNIKGCMPDVQSGGVANAGESELKDGECTHGVMVDWRDGWSHRKEYGGAEDTLSIVDCRIGNFSGDAVHWQNIWCVSIRHTMLCYSRNGLYMNGCDGFFVDNWFSVNRESGVYGDGFMSGTFSDNRFECNLGHGVYYKNTGAMQFTNNYFDANHLAGFYSAEDGEDYRGNIILNSNIFYRSGCEQGREIPDEFNTHINLSRAVNVSIVGNDFFGDYAACKGPKFGMIVGKLRSCVIKDNVMKNAAYEKNFVDLGGHKEDVIIKDNPGIDHAMPTDNKKFWPRFDD